MSRGLKLTLGLALVVAYAGLVSVDQAAAQCGAGCGACSAEKGECVAKCPTCGGAVAKNASIAYKGGDVCFCCAECISKFKKDTAKYQAKANEQLVITGQAKQAQCPLAGGKLNLATKMEVCGIDVCFCCAGCQEKVKSASADKQCEMVFVKGFDKAFVVKKKEEKKADNK